MVGAPSANDGQGEAFVVPLHTGIGTDESILDVMMAKLVGVPGGLGSSTAMDGDVNGDGKADAMVGAPDHSVPESDGGAVALFMGGVSGVLSLPDATVLGTGSDQNVGEAVEYTMDGTTATGFSGLAMGAPGHGSVVGTGVAPASGAVFLLENAFSTSD